MDTFISSLATRWRFMGDIIQSLWGALLDVIGEDPRTLWVVGSTVVIFSVYWLYAIIFTIMDITNRPKFLRKYKIQPGQNEPVDLQKLWKAVKVVLFNLTVLNLGFSWLMFEVVYRYQQNTEIRVLPTFGRALFDFACFVVLEEIMFYYSHRLLHHKAIYKYVHKKHHEWTSPVAAMTLYAHPVEHIVANLIPVGFSLALLRSHIAVAWMVFALAIMNSMNDHAGYSFPWSGGSVRFHDYHHAKFNYNYGVTGWLDKLHGTYRVPHKEGAAKAQKVKTLLKPNQLVKKKSK
ncbi:fatty acid hydroxylase domain-containing protein 2 [Scaptodrosophila lebanonensis]|uniref:Fatty acid hydroxylase domain-containing protein 2 n=1 Tax=Drosophila lebanonensis TaxID=7225 RepID=A0A6J2TQE4_DROLE|nr:fatty acid hydroxylase domain-containing protein 2 [Scaptodrosophila lebanonensis]